jgi:hypothetical protein
MFVEFQMFNSVTVEPLRPRTYKHVIILISDTIEFNMLSVVGSVIESSNSIMR